MKKAKKIGDETIEYFKNKTMAVLTGNGKLEVGRPHLTDCIDLSIHLYEEKLKSCREYIGYGTCYDFNPEYKQIKEVITYLKKLQNE